MQFGEIARRGAFSLLDSMHGGRQKRLKEVTKQEITGGVTEEYIERRTRSILEYASKNCTYYRQFDPESGLAAFPVQTKGDFLDHYEDIISEEYRDDRDKLAKLTTSGSTGTPFTVLADPAKMRHVNMNFMAVMELNGFRLGMKRGEFRAWITGKNTISRFRSFKNNLLMVDISNMSDENIGRIFERIKKERIQVLVTYSSALEALVSYAARRHPDISGWDVEMIFTMGEALPGHVREKAAEIFGITPVLSYGNNENGFIAVSLPGDSDYTVDLYHFNVEILKMDSDEPAGSGELGRIVVTDYYNRAFPMIRYDTGDTGKLETWHDAEGRLHAKFTEIYGRRGSLLYNTKGEPLSIHVFMNNLLRFEGVLRQAKCIQTDLTAYTIELNPEPGAQVDEDAVVASYRGYLGEDADIEVKYVGTLPIQQSGKTLVCEQRCEAYKA
ncbi:MAG: AMP-binding protein [Lachnospiraceae bacterium]|nr:AMP-binding protein [Lachnospiraceae bacterium]